MKAITIGAMHGRHDTVKYCLDRMPFIENYLVYSTDEDGAFLREHAHALAKVSNFPLSNKWSVAISLLRYIEFDYVIILGSDDYINQAFVDFVSEHITDCDMIGFTDIYFEQDNEFHYWSGYSGLNEGQTIGAGRCYTKSFLEKMNYSMYNSEANSGLDRMAYNEIVKFNPRIKTASIKDHNLVLVDVKDGKGITPITSITNRVLTAYPNGN
jgi:hypothetical protein